MTRRRPGQSALTTPRDEKDRVEIQSGTEFGVTLGTPICMVVRNEDQRPKDYGGSTMDLYPRPSHADFTYLEKYGVKASSGGGRSSARETIGEFFLILFLFSSQYDHGRNGCVYGYDYGHNPASLPSDLYRMSSSARDIPTILSYYVLSCRKLTSIFNHQVE